MERHDTHGGTGTRPWYREPWPWVLIAIPLLTVVASGITLWLAITHPDHIVLDEPAYQNVRAELRAQADTETGQAVYQADGER
jgi:hypothetical protein